jgi:hypothetical protein
MASKRKEVINATQKQGKKVKRDPIQEKILGITAALSKAGISTELQGMLDVAAPLSLGDFSDQRHRFQEEVVAAIEGILDDAESKLKADVADKVAKRDATASDRSEREKEAAAATEKLDSKKAEVQRLKVSLAGAATAFRAAKSALSAAEEAKVAEGQTSRESEKKKGDSVIAKNYLDALKTAMPEDAGTKKKEKDLMAQLKKYKFEESMLVALPAALAKSPDARGQFDLMAITQLEAEIDKLIAEQDAVIAAAAPGQAACEAAITAAQEPLTAAQGAQKTAAKAFDTASKEQEELERLSAAAQQASRETTKLWKELERMLTDAEVEVELFQQGPREAFKELRERATPPPVIEAVEEEPVAPMKVEECIGSPTKEHELPVAMVA